jgi:hypothetical protein
MIAYKLAVLDLDDTLLGPDKTIGVENVSAVRRLQKDGVQCILASGRRHENMLRFHRQLELTGPVVSSNGALVKIAETGDILRESVMPESLASEIVAEGLKRNMTMNYYHADGHLLSNEKSPWMYLYEERTGSHSTLDTDLTRHDGKRALKLIWIDAPDRIQTLYDEMNERYGDYLAIVVTDPEYLEFMAPGVNKAEGVTAAAHYFGMNPAEIMAFGDGNNDVELLRWAGLGVAMSHARRSAQAAADRIAPPGNPESSLARAVDMILSTAD